MLVIPSVSTGNVPQLAVDLLISTYGFELKQSLDDEYLHPFAGPRDFTVAKKTTQNAEPSAQSAPRGIATALDLYTLGDHSLVQLRSPPIAHTKGLFVKSLLAQTKPDSESAVLVAASANAGMRTDSPGLSSIVKIPTEVAADPSVKIASTFPGSGFLADVLGQASSSAALVLWTYEGDNVDGAKALAAAIAQELGLPETELLPPASWQHMYGKDVPIGIEHGIYT